MRRTKKQKMMYYNNPELYDKMLTDLEEVEEKVIWLLHHHKELRNNDTLLMFKYWMFIDGYNGEMDQSTISKLTPGESITRARRIIQNIFYKYIPTDEEIIESRKLKEQVVKDWTQRTTENDI